MNIPKQLINLLGAVVVIGVVVAGLALIALPMYGSSQTTDASARTVAQTNDVYDIQVQTLAAERERMDEITTDLASLRRQIAAIPQLDDDTDDDHGTEEVDELLRDIHSASFFA
jgi:Tfp pilus assembly protein PilO